MQNRKQDIIIELGSEWIRVGLVSDKAPRKTIPASDMAFYRNDIPSHQYQIKIQQILYSIFYTHINSSVSNKTVIILQKVFTDRRILEIIADVLFKKFKIQKLEFGLSCVTPLYLSGRFSGITISGGYNSVQIMPVYESYPLVQNFRYIPSGTHAMTKIIKDELLLLNPDAGNEVFEKTINQEYLNDLKNLHSNMNLVESKSQDIVTLNLRRVKLKLKPSSITYSNLFGNPDNEQYNIAYMFLEALSKIDVKMLIPIAQNVVLAGGLWRIKGMQMYFKKRVKEYLPKFQKLQNLKIAQKLRFVSWGFNPSQVSWIGCSVGASVRGIDTLTLRRSEYESERFSQKIMQAYFLSK